MSGWAPGPGVYFEDHREIELTSEAEAQAFEYRSLALAGDEDFFILSSDRDPGFESYLRDFVGLGAPTILRVPQTGRRLRWPLADLCLHDRSIMNKLIYEAQKRKGLNLMPYMATGGTWSLARAIARGSAYAVHVAGPSPRLARRANDKLWFADRVAELFGPRSLPPTLSVYGLSAAAARIKNLAMQYETVVVKITASAGAMGNLTFPSSRFEGRSLVDIRRDLELGLSHLGWRRRFPLLVGVWERPVAASPSAQIWIPALADGPPVIEGIFAQSLIGGAGEFAGAMQAELPATTRNQLVNEAQRLATFFQELRYFGRLSLDAVLVGDSCETAEIHWIECNARWGGVSIPMTVANRLGFDGRARSLAIVQKSLTRTNTIPLSEAKARLDGKLLQCPARQPGAIFLLPLGVEHLAFAVVSNERDDALNLAETVVDVCTRKDSGAETSLQKRPRKN